MARQLKKLGIPVLYLVAPQVWAWRKGRLPLMRRTIDRLLCIFPFEPEFFARHGIDATYIGHPLTRLVKPSASRAELRRRFGYPRRHAAGRPASWQPDRRGRAPFARSAGRGGTPASHCQNPPRFILAVPPGTIPPGSNFRERISGASIQLLEGKTWDVLVCADVALAASGTVTIEACLLGTPMVTFYRVNNLSWWMGKALVRVPFYSMVNLVAERRIVPELIQDQMTAESLAREALALLENDDSAGRYATGSGRSGSKAVGPGRSHGSGGVAGGKASGRKAFNKRGNGSCLVRLCWQCSRWRLLAGRAGQREQGRPHRRG